MGWNIRRLEPEHARSDSKGTRRAAVGHAALAGRGPGTGELAFNGSGPKSPPSGNIAWPIGPLWGWELSPAGNRLTIGSSQGPHRPVQRN